MPISALINDKIVISTLTSKDDWEEYVKISKNNREDVVLYQNPKIQCFPRVSKKGYQHFVSRRGSSKPETAEHIMIKTAVYKYLQDNGWEVYVEQDFPEINRVADVYALSPQGDKVVFEIQLSHQSRQDFQQRTDDYKNLDIETIWITPYLGKIPANIKAIWINIKKNSGITNIEQVYNSQSSLYLNGYESKPYVPFKDLFHEVISYNTCTKYSNQLLQYAYISCWNCNNYVTWWGATTFDLPSSCKGNIAIDDYRRKRLYINRYQNEYDIIKNLYNKKNIKYPPLIHSEKEGTWGYEAQYNPQCPHCKRGWYDKYTYYNHLDPDLEENDRATSRFIIMENKIKDKIPFWSVDNKTKIYHQSMCYEESPININNNFNKYGTYEDQDLLRKELKSIDV